MSKAKKETRSYSVDRRLHQYVVRTRGGASASERLNTLLRRAIRAEQAERLEEEAAAFYASLPRDRKAERALQRATRRSLARD